MATNYSFRAARRNLRRACLICLAGGSVSFTAQAKSFVLEPPLATNIFELYSFISPEEGHVCAYDLTGTVLAEDHDSGTLFFQDPQGPVVLSLPVNQAKLKPGQRIRLRGTNYIAYTEVGLGFGTQPVVDNNFLHSIAKNSGTVFLKAGEHPVRVTYFNRTAEAQLEVTYATNHSAEKRIAGDALWHFEPSPQDGARVKKPGLVYQCFEGGWMKLPDFARLTPVKTGIVSDFDLGVCTRPEYVGVEFNGLVEVPVDGTYHFFLNSDDGSQLFLDFGPPEITVLGTSPLPAPAPMAPGQLLAGHNRSPWAEVEGEISFIFQEDGGAEFELVSGGNPIRIKLLNTPHEFPAYLPNCRVRVQGICPPVRNTYGQSSAGLMMGSGWQSMHLLEVPPENWTRLKMQSIADIRATMATGITNGTVHLKGEIRTNSESATLVLNDGNDSVPIEAMNGSTIKEGTAVDCLAQWFRNGTNLILQQAICSRSPDETNSASNGIHLLTTALQVQQLKSDEAVQKYPVEIKGVVTWMRFWDEVISVVVQDSTRAVFAALNTDSLRTDLHLGDFCEIKGFTLPGDFSPIVKIETITALGKGQLPRPIHPTGEQMLNGSLDAQYIELRGLLTETHDDYVTVLTTEGTFHFNIATESEVPWNKMINAIIRVRGSFFAHWNVQTHRVILDNPTLRIWAATVTVDEPAPADFFQVAPVPAWKSMWFDAKFDPFQWVKISGQIVHGGPGLYYMMNDHTGLRFQLSQPQTFAPGDEVEVVGLVKLAGASPLLHQAVARKTGHAPLVQPRPLSLDSANQPFDATLVSVQGTLVDILERKAATDLEMQAGVKKFIARLDSSQRPPRPWEIGSRLNLTGVFHSLDQSRTSDRGIGSFELLLNSPADVQVLSRPPWWTWERLLTLAAALSAVLIVAAVWIASLRRQVERRTRQLRHEISQREQVESIRAIEVERSRIARDLHDDLGSELTEISMLATTGPGTKVEPEQAVERLQGIAKKTRSMVSALDGVVWVVNARNDRLSSLIEYLASIAEEFLAASGVACRVEIPAITCERIIPAEVRHEVLLAFREAVNNAVRHGRPTTVFLRFSAREDGLTIIIKDNGCGFDTDKVTLGNGLANLQSRMNKIGGQCQIDSNLNQGTTVQLTIPLKDFEVPR